MRKTLIAAPLFAFAAAIVLAGCSGGAGGSGENGALTWDDSPLSKYLYGADMSEKTDEEWQKEFEEQQAKSDEIIAQCMKDEGFEYVAQDYGSSVIYSGDDEEWAPDKREWVEKWGYGIVDWPGRTASNEEGEEENPEEWVDPNQEYIDSLSQSEQEQYWETLYGNMEDQEPNEDGSFDYDWTKAGCQGKASNEVYGDDIWSSDEFKDLTDAISEFYTNFSSDPKVKPLVKKWSTCMADAGFDIDLPDDAYMTISDKQSKIYEEGDPEDPDVWDVDKNPALQELQKEEVKMALADFDCKKDLDYENQYLKLQFEAEEEFIKEHKAELDAFLASQEAASDKK